MCPTGLSSGVNNGWQIAGTLYVTSHVVVSYLKMWEHTKRAAIGSMLIIIACMILAYFILKVIFKPLNQVQQQAESDSQKRFDVNTKIPFTTELRSVTNAINKMVSNLQKTLTR